MTTPYRYQFQGHPRRTTWRKDFLVRANGVLIDWTAGPITAQFGLRQSESDRFLGDDYGFFPNPPSPTPSAMIRASSEDGSGVITLPSAGIIRVYLSPNTYNFTPGYYDGAIAIVGPPPDGDVTQLIDFKLPIYDGVL